ncbi:MAG TPA: hypothetical protein VIM07_14160 [Chitinophagaceae bacterium]
MKLKIFTSIFFLFMLGCSSSKITSSWKAENVQPKKYSKIIVLGLIREADRTLREKMEAHLVGDLHDIGYNAISSMSVFGPKAFKRMTEDSAINNIKDVGADAVITIVLLDKSKEQRYIPARRNFYGAANFNRFGGYYTTMYDRVYAAGYYVTDTRYFWESNLYDMATKQLLYSVQTQSFSPSSSEELGHEYGKMIVNNMVKKHVLMQQ